MIILYKNLMKFLILSSLLIPINLALAGEAKFPKSLEERKRDEMGSILGDKSIKLNLNDSHQVTNRPISKSKSLITEKNYIWIAALESVKYMPLNSADYNGGIIITDWVSNNNKSTQRFKLSIYIKDKAISPQSIEIYIYGEEFRLGRWIADRNKHEFLKTKLNNDILSRARELKLQSGRNK